MKNFRIYLFSSIALLQCCSKPSVIHNHYKANLNNDLSRNITTYISKAKFNKKNSFVTISWIGFFKGDATYIGSSKSHPKRFDEYPIAWTYVDSALVFIYDSRYKNYFSDSVGLKREIDNELSKIKAKEDPYLVEDNLPLRFIKTDKSEIIDTSYLNLKICK